MRFVLLAVMVSFVLGAGPADAKRAATRVACVERCDATTGACISAAGESVSKKTERRCRRRTLRRCMRTGLDACPQPDPCPATPDIVGTWESSDVTCVRQCLVGSTDDIQELPCEPAEQPPFRITVNGQGTACEVFSVTKPFGGIGIMNLGATPITFSLTDLSPIPAPARSSVRGAIDGNALTGVTMSWGILNFPPFCSTRLTVGPMTRVAVD